MYDGWRAEEGLGRGDGEVSKGGRWRRGKC